MRSTNLFGYSFLFALALALTTCNSSRDDYIIGIRENIHHDDFEYSVTGFERTLPGDILNSKQDKSAEMLYLVHFRVENRAMRVEHRWNNSIAYLVDDSGKKYENSSEDQILLDKTLNFGWHSEYITYHGTSDSTILVFRVPSGIKNPCLKVRGDILMGDALDGARFRKIKIRLY